MRLEDDLFRYPLFVAVQKAHISRCCYGLELASYHRLLTAYCLLPSSSNEKIVSPLNSFG